MDKYFLAKYFNDEIEELNFLSHFIKTFRGLVSRNHHLEAAEFLTVMKTEFPVFDNKTFADLFGIKIQMMKNYLMIDMMPESVKDRIFYQNLNIPIRKIFEIAQMNDEKSMHDAIDKLLRKNPNIQKSNTKEHNYHILLRKLSQLEKDAQIFYENNIRELYLEDEEVVVFRNILFDIHETVEGMLEDSVAALAE